MGKFIHNQVCKRFRCDQWSVTGKQLVAPIANWLQVLCHFIFILNVTAALLVFSSPLLCLICQRTWRRCDIWRLTLQNSRNFIVALNYRDAKKNNNLVSVFRFSRENRRSTIRTHSIHRLSHVPEVTDAHHSWLGLELESASNYQAALLIFILIFTIIKKKSWFLPLHSLQTSLSGPTLSLLPNWMTPHSCWSTYNTMTCQTLRQRTPPPSQKNPSPPSLPELLPLIITWSKNPTWFWSDDIEHWTTAEAWKSTRDISSDRV